MQNIASEIICDHFGLLINLENDINQIRIAFDGDAVIFSDESEKYINQRVCRLLLSMNIKMHKIHCLKDRLLNC